jgi:Uma2 family endonuclease
LKSESPQPPIPERVPDIVYEIVSPGRKAQHRDYVFKRAQYRQFGVREYVIVDRLAKKVTVVDWSLGNETERSLTTADHYTSSLLPGLSIPLVEVL